MNTKIKESQSFHDSFTIMVLGIIFLMGAWRIPEVFNEGTLTSQLMFGLAFLTVLAVIAFVFYSEMNIKIGKNKIKVGVNSLPWSQTSIAKEDIVDMEFFTTNTLNAASDFLHFGGNVKIYNFGDNSGVVMRMKDDKRIIIFSEKVYNAQDDLMGIVEGNS